MINKNKIIKIIPSIGPLTPVLKTKKSIKNKFGIEKNKNLCFLYFKEKKVSNMELGPEIYLIVSPKRKSLFASETKLFIIAKILKIANTVNICSFSKLAVRIFLQIFN